MTSIRLGGVEPIQPVGSDVKDHGTNSGIIKSVDSEIKDYGTKSGTLQSVGSDIKDQRYQKWDFTVGW